MNAEEVMARAEVAKLEALKHIPRDSAVELVGYAAQQAFNTHTDLDLTEIQSVPPELELAFSQFRSLYLQFLNAPSDGATVPLLHPGGQSYE